MFYAVFFVVFWVVFSPTFLWLFVDINLLLLVPYFPPIEQDSFQKKLKIAQAKINETTEDGMQEVDGGTKLQLWLESAGGRTRGRVYGTADLSVNLRRGCTSFTQQSQNDNGSMFGLSLEAERAARVKAEQKAARAEQKADNALAQSQVAIEQNKVAMEQNKKLENDLANLYKIVMEQRAAMEHLSANGSCSATHHSHPHYDDDLDDQSLHSDS